MNSENRQFSCSLSNEILKSYQVLVSLVSQVAPNDINNKVIDGTGGKISVRDIVAYQIGWGKLLVGWYQCGLVGKAPEMPGEGFQSWDYAGLAQHFYQKYHLEGLCEQLTEFNKLVEEILEIVEKEHKSGCLDMVNVWSWCTLKSGKHWPLSKWIRVNTVSPYKRASQSIRKGDLMKKQGEV